MRHPILEKRIIPVTHPTDNQKAVLAKITAAATPKLAAAEISETANLAAARDMLVKMGLIELDDEGAHITDEGHEVMMNQNLVSQDGALTDDGQEAAYGKEQAQQAAEPEAPGLDSGFEEPGGDMDISGGPGDDDFDFDDMFDEEGDDEKEDVQNPDDVREPKEGFSLLSNLRENATRNKFQHVPEDFMQQLNKREVQQLKAVVEKDIPIYKFNSLYQKAYEHFVSEMPYGTAKGRTGDPGEWLQDRLSG